MLSEILFVLDWQTVRIDFSPFSGLTPTTTVLNYLRSLPHHKGVKEGCAEGDCGACTVVIGEPGPDNSIQYKAVDSCLVFLPMLHGKHLITVENLKTVEGSLHPVQHAMVESHASQCGFCTPGIVMSLFALYKNHAHPSRSKMAESLEGNLCRCTGYKPIVEAAAASCVNEGYDEVTTREQHVLALLRTIPKETLELRTEDQVYFTPSTLADALRLKSEHPAAHVISGATDVALRVTKQNELLKKIIDLSSVPDLKSVQREPGSITIGAGVTLSDIFHQIRDDFPALAETVSVFGSLQIRNLATLGGNLGTASPIGDMLSALIPHKGEVLLQSIDGIHNLPLDGFVTGYRQTLRRSDELIVAVKIPRLNQDTTIKWYKVSKRKALDISTVSGGFRLEREPDGRIAAAIFAYGGMADKVKRATTAETDVIGKTWTRETVEQAMELIINEFSPISDTRGSSAFRRVAARNLLLKFWSETQEQGTDGERA